MTPEEINPVMTSTNIPDLKDALKTLLSAIRSPDDAIHAIHVIDMYRRRTHPCPHCGRTIDCPSPLLSSIL